LLLFLLLASFVADRALSALPLANAVRIDLVGHQFWWEARYESHSPELTFSTANELHVPVGRPVLVRLRADDVIHSFWVPSLSGKKDLIPGHESTIALRADRAGTYRGQCAEFCGYQHAQMALVVVADPPADYERWQALQREPARAPETAQERRGLELVEQTSCAMCHAIHGTRARARRAPDLTHVASRGWLGAGAVENTPALRAEWIANAQKFKPGINMPLMDDARALPLRPRPRRRSRAKAQASDRRELLRDGDGAGSRAAAELERTWQDKPGLRGFLSANGHKTTGLRFVVTAFVFAGLAGIMGGLMRHQLATANSHLVGPDFYNQLFSMHGTAMMFLFAVPVMQGFALYVVPLMIGTRNTAFPRMSACAYWLYLLGGLLLFGAFATNTGPDA